MYDSHVKAYKSHKAKQTFESMGGYGMIGGILSAIGNATIGGINAAQQSKWNKQQQENWNKQFEYTKWLNQQQMMREDTAIQRRAADLEKAGMNRLMAAGDGAEAGTLTSFQGNAGGSAPQFEGNPIESFLAAKQSQANIANTEAQTQLIRNKAETEKAKKELTISQKGLAEVLQAKNKKEGVKIMIDTLRDLNDYNIEKESGLKSNDTSRANNLYSTIDLLIRVMAQKFGINIWDKFKAAENKNKAFEKDENGNFKYFDKAAEEIAKMYGAVY